MAMVIRVRFKRASKLYDFDPAGLELHNGMHVVTETARGVELGECMSGIMEIPDERVNAPLKPILRIATEQDMLTQKRNEEYEKEAFDIAVERIADHKLEMKLVDVEYAFDHSKIIFYFTANGRVDFRMLVKNLASIFKTRIELRQIGVRDEAKMLGGIGPCGRPICCRTFLGDFTPVSIKMAKEQCLSLNPTKISGLCDRLMCCLKYEQDQYEATRKRMPRVGRDIQTPDGIGTINAINVLEETVRVRISVGDAFELREYPIDSCKRLEANNAPQEGREAGPDQANRAEETEQGEHPERSGKPERAERPERSGKPERAERPERSGKPEKTERPERSGKPERTERPERSGKPERAERPERSGKPERAERPERGEKPARGERRDKPERGEKPERPEKGDRLNKGKRPEEKGERHEPRFPRQGDKGPRPQMPREAPVKPQADETESSTGMLEIVEETIVEDLL